MTAAPGTVRRALLSVHDKEGIEEVGRRLARLRVEILASGGTASALESAGIPVTRVEEVTGVPALLGGRVKTLHPHVHAGLLADRRDPAHMRELERLGIAPIDLVVCDLSPFGEAASGPEAAGRIDIGGPALVRAAAKNADGGVTVVVDPADRERVLDLLEAGGAVPPEERRALAARAFRRTARYEAAVAAWAAREAGQADPELALGSLEPAGALRYGENPHQRGYLYLEPGGRGVAGARLLQGKALSYNNLLDLDAAYRAAYGPGPDRCAVVKHTNPCGLAEADTQPEAFLRALSGDPVAAFGSVLGFSREVGGATARAIVESGLFVEAIAAPGFDEEARVALAARRNLRLVAVPPGDPSPTYGVHRIGGGLLVQEPDPGPEPDRAWRVVTAAAPGPEVRGELAFALRVVAALRSNAVCVTSDRTLRGVGAGLMSRIDACRLALEKAGPHAAGAVLASDGFFPFDDCVRLAAAAGIAAVAQPGGSRRDAEVIRACDELGVAMVFTGRRHFRH